MPPSAQVYKARMVWRVSGLTVILAIAGVGSLLANPLIATQEELKQREAVIESVRATEAKIKAKLTEAEAVINALRDQEGVRRERSDPKNDETAFLHWANSHASLCELAVRDFRPSNRQTHGEYTYRTVVLSTQGSYASICLFLDKLRQCPQMLRVASFDILPQDQARTTFVATFNILLITQEPMPIAETTRGRN
ncbi:MAG: hypothetical protein R3C53_08760 [Pirellulaceae bacterium]